MENASLEAYWSFYMLLLSPLGASNPTINQKYSWSDQEDHNSKNFLMYHRTIEVMNHKWSKKMLVLLFCWLGRLTSLDLLTMTPIMTFITAGNNSFKGSTACSILCFTRASTSVGHDASNWFTCFTNWPDSESSPIMAFTSCITCAPNTTFKCNSQNMPNGHNLMCYQHCIELVLSQCNKKYEN